MPNDTRKNIIDIHCHTAGIGAGESGCFVSPALMGSWKYRFYLRAFGVTEQELKREGDGLVMRRTSERLAQSERVASAVILAMDGVVDASGNLDRSRTEMFIPNEFVAKETAKYPNLLFGASINPLRVDAIERLEQAALSGAVLLKWLPAIQHIDPADERLIPFYLKLKQLGLPLLTHTGKESSFTSAKEQLGDPERLRLPLTLGVRVIAAHTASSGKSHGEANHERFLRLCRQFPNLYADISALTQINRLGHLQRILKQTELHGRLLYGTDMPLLRTPLVTPFAYPHVLPFRRMVEIASIDNVWDRDVALKEALGVPDLVFNNVQWMNSKDDPR